jgi:vitamin B12 transporter
MQAQISRDVSFLQLIAGVDWMAYDFDQSQAGPAASAATQNRARSDFNNLGAFVMPKLYFGEKRDLVVSGGIRFDTYDISVDAEKIQEELTVSRDIQKDNWAPSIGFAYSPKDSVKVRANYARAFRMPLPRQLTGYTIMMTTPFIGNPALKPEKSDNWDAGFDFGDKYFQASGTFFYSKYKDMIGYETHSGSDEHYSEGTHYWYYNVEEATINGIEAGGRFDVGMQAGLSFSLEPYIYWTHLFELEDGSGNKLENRSADSLSFGVGLDHRSIGFAAGLGATYYGTQYSSASEKIENVGEATIVDLRLSQRLWRFSNQGNVRFKFSVKNLFDTHYATNEDSWSPGRSFAFGLAYDY